MQIIKQSLKVQSFLWNIGTTIGYDSGAEGTYQTPVWLGNNKPPYTTLKYITVNVITAFAAPGNNATIKIQTISGVNLLSGVLSANPVAKFTTVGIYGGDPIADWGGAASNTYTVIGAGYLNIVIGVEAIAAGQAIFTFEYY